MDKSVHGRLWWQSWQDGINRGFYHEMLLMYTVTMHSNLLDPDYISEIYDIIRHFLFIYLCKM